MQEFANFPSRRSKLCHTYFFHFLEGHVSLSFWKIKMGSHKAVLHHTREPGVNENRMTKLALCAAIGMSCATVSFGASQIQNGANGARGTTGAPGNPGGNGTPGQDAPPANLTVSTADSGNSASVFAGAGGPGGNGGDGVPAGARGGNGGAGGAGGSATAIAVTAVGLVLSGVDTVSAVAVAFGGNGGGGGNGGSVNTPYAGTPGDGGRGGMASASATSAGMSVNSVAATSNAIGGDGRAPGTGSGTSRGGNGGNAHASAAASNTDQFVSATATATGGHGGNAVGDDALAGAGGVGIIDSVNATMTGTGSAVAQATQIGGDGGNGTNGALGGNGGSSILSNAVSGSTSGMLTLKQYATGGFGGEAGGNGGDAQSSLTYTDSQAQSLIVDLRATGGHAGIGNGSISSGSAGSAAVGATITGAHDVTITATASGGWGGNNSTGLASGGGSAVLNPIVGISTGNGDVSVSGTAGGGPAGSSPFVTTNSAPVALFNAVDGISGGNVSLTQIASSSGASAISSLNKSTTSTSLSIYVRAEIGAPYAATSIANADGTNNGGQVYSNANATAFMGTSNASATATTSGDGHTAQATSTADNSGAENGGDAYVSDSSASSNSVALAEGSSQAIATDRAVGGLGPTATATSHASAANFGSAPVSASANAMGGKSGTGPGGAAVATARGTSAGGGNVTVIATQQPGIGINGANTSMTDAVIGETSGILTLEQNAIGGTSLADAGGNATSSLTEFADISSTSVIGTSSATGGATGGRLVLGSQFQFPHGNGGDATSTINLGGNRDVSAIAIATGGAPVVSSTFTMGSATASSRATTAIGLARADSSSNGISGKAESFADAASGIVNNAEAHALAPANGQANHVESRSSVGQPAPAASLASGLQSASFLTAMPATSDSLAALAQHSIAKDFNVDGQGSGPQSDALGLVVLSGFSSGSTNSQTYSASASEVIDISKLPSPQHILLGLLDPTSAGNGFDSLHFRATINNVTAIDQTFTDLSSALTYFSDHTVDEGPTMAGADGMLHLSWQLDLTSTPNEGFGTDFIVANSTVDSAATPEPGTLSLLGCALACLLRPRRRNTN